MIDYLKEIALKLWNLGKVWVPGIAALEGFRLLFVYIGVGIKAWFLSLVDEVKAMITEQMDQLGVDLAPPQAVLDFVAKINVLIPLTEAWHYFLLYLGVASVVVGVKWLRNLVPSWS